MKLVIVGGTAAGMSCAARARRLDENAEIIVFERQRYVSSASCGLPYFVGGEISDADQLTVQTPESLRGSLNLDVRPEHEVVALDPEHRQLTVLSKAGSKLVSYDALVLTPGTEAARPPIEGLDSTRVHTLRTVDDALQVDKLAAEIDTAVVLGGGFIGVETAEALANRGIRVTLVEAASHVLPPLEEELAAVAAEALSELEIDLRVGVLAQKIEHQSNADTVHLSDGTTITAELIILSTGVRPATSVFEQAGVACERGAIVTDKHGATNLGHIWAAGDATQMQDEVTGVRRPVALAGPANRSGRLTADAIFDPANAQPIPTAISTAIVRIGNTTIASTGASRATLAAAGTKFHTIHLHPTQHAGYFPGAAPISMLLHFATDGRLLGAQTAGIEGADKRIDILATAIRAKLHADGLIDLDLAYSPPYGHAKDPVNLAGMVAQNVLDGSLKLWYAQDLDQVADHSLILDVRSREEYGAGHISSALNIPHDELRERLAEARTAAAGRPVRILCGSGMRSYLAHRVLSAAGFDSASLSGGMRTLTTLIGESALITDATQLTEATR